MALTSAQLSKLILDKTRNGEEIVDFAIGVMRGVAFPKTNEYGETYESSATLRERIEAAKFLSDRAFGKPQESVTIDSAVAARNVNELSVEELIGIVRATGPSAFQH